MRMLRLAVVVMVGVFISRGAPVRAQEQEVTTYGKQAMESLGNLLDKGKKDGFKMEAKKTTMFGAWLPKGNNAGNEEWITVLVLGAPDATKQYRILCAGDNDTIDLDVRVLDAAGGVVAIDPKADRECEVTFQPKGQQNYTIQMRLYNSKDNCLCMGAILVK
jgi:hypothetical protein